VYKKTISFAGDAAGNGIRIADDGYQGEWYPLRGWAAKNLEML